MKYLAISPAKKHHSDSIKVISASFPHKPITRIPRESIGEFRSKFKREGHGADPAAMIEVALWKCNEALQEARATRQDLTEKIDTGTRETMRLQTRVEGSRKDVERHVAIIKRCAKAIFEVCTKADEGNRLILKLEERCAIEAVKIPLAAEQVEKCSEKIAKDGMLISKGIAIDLGKMSPAPSAKLISYCQSALVHLNEAYSGLSEYAGRLVETYCQEGIFGLASDSPELYEIIKAKKLDADMGDSIEKGMAERIKSLRTSAKLAYAQLRPVMEPVEKANKAATNVMNATRKAGNGNTPYERSKQSCEICGNSIEIAKSIIFLINSFPEHHAAIAESIAAYAKEVGALDAAIAIRDKATAEMASMKADGKAAGERAKIDECITELGCLKQRLEQELASIEKRQKKKEGDARRHGENRYTAEKWKEHLLEIEIEGLPKFVKLKKQIEQEPKDAGKKQAMARFFESARIIFKDELKAKNQLSEPFLNRLRELAEMYLKNGMLTRKIIQETYSGGLTHHGRVIGNNSSQFVLVRLSLGRNSEKRMIIDVKDGAMPIVYFVGGKESSKKFMNRVNNQELPEIKAVAVRNGVDGLFPSLLEKPEQ
ncbi:MAG: hypothetical protein NTX79_06855 [Candidatus Micrarchaeota archaeon]|nr:hypothetical protein [Candidatus Micrarchaeota archaeon]